MRVTVVFDQEATRAVGEEAEAIARVGDSVRGIAQALRARGHEVREVGLGGCPLATIASLRGSVVFNLAESFAGSSALEPAVAGAFELAGVAYTGAPPSALDRCLNKSVARLVLREAGVPVPAGRVLERGGEPLEDLCFPVIVKPVAQDASHGIDESSVVADAGAARARAAILRERYGAGALVEEYIEGRELNASVLATPDGPRVLPVAEIDYSKFPGGRPKILTYAAKWEEQSADYQGSTSVRAELDGATRAAVEGCALAAWHALGLRGYARVDMRLCPRRGPFVIDVNPNPDVSEGAGFSLAAERGGLTYPELIEAIVLDAASRLPEVRERVLPESSLRELRAGDRERLLEILQATDAFRSHEIDVALEVIDAVLEAPEEGYRSCVAERDGEVAGYCIWGHAPMTAGAFDLYWIAVDPALHGGGVGRTLMAEAERRAAGEGATMMLVETSGQPSYAATRAFYERIGYVEVARVPDYYRDGDDKLVYARRLSRTP